MSDHNELLSLLDRQADEIAKAGLPGWGNTMLDAAAAIREVEAATIERCAKVCDKVAEGANKMHIESAIQVVWTCEDLAKAIRAIAPDRTAATQEHGDTNLPKEDSLPASAAALSGTGGLYGKPTTAPTLGQFEQTAINAKAEAISKTPRTDAALATATHHDRTEWQHLYTLCRQLERELNAKAAQCTCLTSEAMCDYCKAKLNEQEALRLEEMEIAAKICEAWPYHEIPDALIKANAPECDQCAWLIRAEIARRRKSPTEGEVK